MELNLTKPIVFFDLETTGVQVGHDRIVQICLLKILPDGSQQCVTKLVRPADEQGKTLPIPPETTAIHGITNEMVAHEPSFKEQASEIASFIGDADLAGYNSNKFDIPLLVEEFLRAGYNFTLQGRRMVDVQSIFHKMEQRTLKAAYRFYCGKKLENAHSADADTMATYEVLKAELDRYNGTEYEEHDGRVTKPIVNDIDALAAFTANSQWADLVGHIGYDERGHEVFNFGKYKGKTLYEVFGKEPSYYDWMMKADFPLSTKHVVSQVYERMRKEKQERRERYERETHDKLEQLKMKFQGEK